MQYTLPGGYYYYARPGTWYGYGVNQQEGPKIVELEPSELGGARSQIDARSDLTTYQRYSGTNGIGTNKRHVECGPVYNETVTSRRLGTRNYTLDGSTMHNGKGDNRQMKPRSWKEVNDDISARMFAAASDSPPIIPKRDYDSSPAPSLPRPSRSVSSTEAGARKRYHLEDNSRSMNGPDGEWSGVDDYARQSSYNMEHGETSPSNGQSQQLVLYTGPPAPPPPPMPYHHPGMPYDPSSFPPGIPPFGPAMFPPPPDLYGYGGMGPPPPVFMDHPPQPGMENGDGLYGPPPIMPFPPPPPHAPMPFMPPVFPMDFEMFVWNQQKSKKKGRKGPKRSKSMEYLIPPPMLPPPPPPWAMPPPPPVLIPPPPFHDDPNAMYGVFGPPRPPPPPFALPPPMGHHSTPTFPPPPPMPYSSPSVNKEQTNGRKAQVDKSAQKSGTGKSSKEKSGKRSTCYLLCCKGFTQILWIIIGIILVGLVLGLVLGLTLV